MWVQSYFAGMFGSMQQLIGESIAQSAGTARPFFGACAAAMIAVMAGQAANSPQGGEAFGRLLYRLFLVGVIFAFTLNPDTYQGEIAQVAWNLPRDWLGMIARRAGTDDPAAIIDQALASTSATARAYAAIGAQRGPWSGFGWQIASWVVYGMGAVMCFGAAAVLMASMMLLTLAISVGPVFGSMLAFQMTRGMGMAWTGTMIAPGLAVALGSAVLLIAFGYWDQTIVSAAMNAQMGMGGLVETVGTGLAGIVSIGAASTLGYTLGRGVQPALSGFMANMQRSAMSMAGGLGGLASMARPRNAMHLIARAGQDARIIRAPVRAIQAAWRGRP